MNKVSVRCWKMHSNENSHHKITLYITYPEDNTGHDLITCNECGEVYAVTVAKEVYIGPSLADKLKKVACVNCGKPMDSNYSYYPETYIVNREKFYFKRPMEIPIDSESTIVEFWGIYD